MAFHFEDTSWEVFYLEEEERMKKKFGFVSSLSLLFSHMENLEKHAMGRALLTQKDENSPEKDDLMIKKYPIKFYLL